MNLDEIERKSLIGTGIAMLASFVVSVVLGVGVVVVGVALSAGSTSDGDWAAFGLIIGFLILASLIAYLVYAAIGVWQLRKAIPPGRRALPIAGLLLAPLIVTIASFILSSIPLIGVIFSFVGIALSFIGPPLCVWGGLRLNRPGAPLADTYTQVA